jgi:hypothetical protein
MTTLGDYIATQNRPFVRLAIATGLILLIPLVAAQLSDEVTWTLGDFVVLGALLFGSGLAFVFFARRMKKHRAVIGGAILAALLLVWAELAVGVFTGLGS